MNAWVWWLVYLVIFFACLCNGGIPGFNRYLLSHPFQSSYRIVPAGCTTLCVDHLCIDMAAALHESLKDDTNSARLGKRLFHRLDRLLSLTNPRKSVVFAFDGVAPYAKMTTQRKRRISGSPGCVLTPGTELMQSMEAQMMTYILQRGKSISEKNPDVRVFISGPEDPVEGEVKLVDWIMNHVFSRHSLASINNVKHHDEAKDSVLIVGSDGDLIVQSLILGALKMQMPPSMVNPIDRSGSYHPFPNLLSADQHGSKPRGYVLRNMTRIFDIFSSWLHPLSMSNLSDTRPFAADIALLLLFLGDDYLPRLRTHSFPLLFEYLSKTWDTQSISHLYDLDKKHLNWLQFYQFMSKLSEFSPPSYVNKIDKCHESTSLDYITNVYKSSFNITSEQSYITIPKVEPIQVWEVWRSRHKDVTVHWEDAAVSLVSNRTFDCSDSNDLRQKNANHKSSISKDWHTYTTDGSESFLPINFMPDFASYRHLAANKSFPSVSVKSDTAESVFKSDPNNEFQSKLYKSTEIESRQKADHSTCLYTSAATVTLLVNGTTHVKQSPNNTITKRYQPIGLFRSLKAAKRAVALLMLQDLDPLVYETSYLQENERVQKLQFKLNQWVENFNQQLLHPLHTETNDFISFLRHLGDEDSDAIEILRRLDLLRLRPPLPADIETYLSGLLWVMNMYSTGKCADFGFHYSELYRPSLSPLDIAQYLYTMQQIYGKENAFQVVSQRLTRQCQLGGNTIVSSPLRDDVCALSILPPNAEEAVPTALRKLWRVVQKELFHETFPSNHTLMAEDEELGTVVPTATVMDNCDYETFVHNVEQLVTTVGVPLANLTAPITRPSKYRWKYLQLKKPTDSNNKHNNDYRGYETRYHKIPFALSPMPGKHGCFLLDRGCFPNWRSQLEKWQLYIEDD